MAQTFEERVEDVLGALHGMAWPLLEEVEKKTIIGKITKGIDKGDTIASWAHALGVDARTIGRRVERFRRSEVIDPTSTPEWQKARVRHARAAIKDKDLLEDLLEDPKVFAALSERFEPAGTEDGWGSGSAATSSKREAPGVPARSVDLAWHHMKVAVAYIQEGRLTPVDRTELDRVTPRVIAAAEYILSTIKGEAVSDWDAALAELEG